MRFTLFNSHKLIYTTGVRSFAIKKTRVRFFTSKGDGNVNARIQGMGERDGSHPTPGLFELLRQELKLRNYSYKTVSAYSSCLRGLVRYFAPRHPRELSSTDIRNYLLHLIEDEGIAASTVNQVLNALPFL